MQYEPRADRWSPVNGGARFDWDVVIVGSGPAGLGTAYRLLSSGLRVSIVEKTSDVGGRTRSVRVADEVVNTGAMFVYVGTETERLCEELAVPTVPVSPATFGVHVDGRTVLARTDDELLDQLGLPPEATAQLARVMQEVRREYETYIGAHGLTPESRQLAEVTYSQHLGDLHPTVQGIVDNAVTGGSTASPQELSAQYALRYFASYLVRASGHRRYIPGGMQEVCNALRAQLPPGTVRLNSTVRGVRPLASGGYELQIDGPDGPMRITAEQVVCATPGPAVRELAPWLPTDKLAAIDQVRTNPTVVLSIVVDSEGMTAWDDLFIVVTVDTGFNLVMQPRASADIRPSEHGRTYFNCYLSADSLATEPGDDGSFTTAWLEQFFLVLPEARGRVLGTLLTRWPRCFAFPAPGREELLDDIRRPEGGLHLLGDYTSATAGSHGAFEESIRVAEAIVEPHRRSPSARAVS
jgi:protoporphyrinogen oxidase